MCELKEKRGYLNIARPSRWLWSTVPYSLYKGSNVAWEFEAISVTSAPLHMNGENFQKWAFRLGHERCLWWPDREATGQLGSGRGSERKVLLHFCGCMSIEEMHVLTFESMREREGVEILRGGREGGVVFILWERKFIFTKSCVEQDTLTLLLWFHMGIPTV